MSSPNKNLNQYFAAARAQEPSLPLEELTQQIARHSAGAAKGAKASAVAGNKNLFWAMGAAGAGLGASVVTAFFSGFFVSFLTVGLGLSFYFFGVRYSRLYYFYHNRGWSKVGLLLVSFLLNFCVYLSYLSINFLLHHGR